MYNSAEAMTCDFFGLWMNQGN